MLTLSAFFHPLCVCIPGRVRYGVAPGLRSQPLSFTNPVYIACAEGSVSLLTASTWLRLYLLLVPSLLYVCMIPGVHIGLDTIFAAIVQPVTLPFSVIEFAYRFYFFALAATLVPFWCAILLYRSVHYKPSSLYVCLPSLLGATRP